MCGINGFSWKDDILIGKMNEVTYFRGPDDQGVFTDGNVSLGHNRLSIIDLSMNGHQPMTNENGSVWITYNGEVYNYRDLRGDLEQKGHVFVSESDTEVIVHAYEEWGIECVQKFNGMWAFCLYDKNRGVFYLCRDQFGIKPLYYHIQEKGIIFSSMISGIISHGTGVSPNDKAIMQFLAYNLEDHTDATFFNKIRKVPAGSYLRYNLSDRECSINSWYNSRNRENSSIPGTIKDLFIESVRARTIADVPIGSCLSGGIDSSSIVCILDKILNSSFNTYSFVMPGHPHDETEYIREVGKFTKTRQFFTQVEEEGFIEEFPDFVRCQEEPVTGMSPYAQYRVMKLANENGAKVLLDGQGGDEIFAGYEYYFSYYFLQLVFSFRWGTLIREAVAYSKNFRNFYPHRLFVFLLLPEFLKSQLWKKFEKRWVNHAFLNEICSNERDPRWRRMNLDSVLKLTLFSTAIPHLLRWEDKNSMRWSIESRPPFLDVHLVEAALSLPGNEKIRNGRTKVLFLSAVSDILPRMIRDRRHKIGFETPVDEFFRRENIVRYCTDIIYSDSFRNRRYWNWDIVEAMFRDHVNKRISIGDTIWKWINLELWLREFFPCSRADPIRCDP